MVGLSGWYDDPDNQRYVQLSCVERHWANVSRLLQGGWTELGRLRIALSEAAQRRGDLILSDSPKFLWVTEFPLFTRADEDKEFLAHGRWSSSHHPFTAPMWEDIEKMYAGKVEEVRALMPHCLPRCVF